MKKYIANHNFNCLKTNQNVRLKWWLIGVAVFLVLAIIGITNKNSNKDVATKSYHETTSQKTGPISQKPDNQDVSVDIVPPLYTVLSVTDGDTIRIDYNGVSTPVRIIGVNTPETVDSRTTVECFGKEASEYLKNKLTDKKVILESDPTQPDRDKYDRLLRYVYLDGEDIGFSIISDGYGYEYTYNVPYQKQSEYKAAQEQASTNKNGLWSPSTCNGQKTSPAPSSGSQTAPTPTPTPAPAPQTQPNTNCDIKGNISSSGEKIYHMPGQRYYDKTVIDTSKGERYFCTEQDAINAGWRKSKV